MSKAEFVPYDEGVHKAEYLKMFSEYVRWLDSQVFEHYGVHLIQGDFESFITRLTPRYTAIKPPEGIIFIMEVDGKTAGTSRLDKIADKIGMVHNVFIYPEHRGKGYSVEMMAVIEEKAKEFGYTSLRLDTARFNVVAHNLYKKLGYVDIERFTDFDNLKNEITRQYYLEKIYMEKRLD